MLYLFTWIHFLNGEECVTGHGSELNSLDKETTWTFDVHMIRSCILIMRQICSVSRHQADHILQLFFYFWAGRYNKTLNNWPCGKQWVLFPINLNVPPLATFTALLIICFLFKDGCVFTSHSLRRLCGGGSSRSGYASI